VSATRLVRRPIDADVLLREVADQAHGAVVLFLGTVREQNGGRAVHGIDYSAYEPMAERELATIVAEARTAYDVDALVVEHRLGTLGLGEVSVGIAAAHERRSPALQALHYVIE
jgi:molybdopterin synthase catalytic subunit